MSDDLRLSLTIKNNVVLELMEDRGIRSVSELCRRVGTSQSQVGLLLNFKISPRGKTVKWLKAVLVLADFFGVTPDLLFPDDLIEMADAGFKNRREVKISTAELTYAFLASQEQQCLNPEQLMIASESMTGTLEDETDAVLKTLTVREEEVVRMRFGIDQGEEASLEEVGRHFNVTRERIRQIESKALRGLRHSTRADRLRPHLEVLR